MASVLALSTVDRGLQPWLCQVNDFKIKYLLLVRKARSIKEKEQSLVGSELG